MVVTPIESAHASALPAFAGHAANPRSEFVYPIQSALADEPELAHEVIIYFLRQSQAVPGRADPTQLGRV
jgi:hypothetical protein